MSKVLFSIIVGIAAGTIDMIPMVIKKLDKKACLSAFFHYLLLSIIIINIDISFLHWYLKGGLLALVFSLPILIIVSSYDRKAIPIMLVTALIFGSLLGTFAHFFYPDLSKSTGQNALESTFVLLKKQADQWDQDIINKKTVAIAANMSSDFRHISKNGAVSDKNTFLDSIVSPDLTIDPYKVEDLEIRIYGDCAILHGTTRMSGTYRGQPFKSNYRYTDIYVHVADQWKVCQVQISPLPE